MRVVKFVLWGLIALLLLAVIGVGVFVSTFDPNSYRELLGERIERATGRRLSINGELSLTVWPQIALRAEQISLANPKGFTSEQPMLQATALEATIAVEPLLQREVKIDGVVLYSPVLALEQTQAGINNWSDLQERFGSTQDEGADELAVQLTAITLRDARISLQQPDTLMRLSALDMDANFATTSELSLTISGAWQTDAATKPAPFTLQTDIAISEAKILLTDIALTSTLPEGLTAKNDETLALTTPKVELDADLNTATMKQGTIQLANSNLNVSATLTNLLEATQLTSNISTKGADTAALVALAGIELPENLPVTRLGPLDLTATLAASLGDDDAGEIQVQRFTANLNRLQLKTDGTLRLGPTGTTRGKLNVGAPIDLSDLARALPELFGPDLFRTAASTSTAGVKPTLQSLQTNFKWTPAKGRSLAKLDFSNTRFSALGITGSATGQTQLTEPTVTTATTLVLDELSPKQVLTYFADAVLTEDPSAFSSASGTLSFLQDATGTHLRDLNITLDKSRLSGEISLLDAVVPTLRFNTTLDTLNATGYLAPTEAITPDTSADSELLGDMVLPTELLRAYDLDGSFRIGRLQLYDLLLGDTGARITLGNGEATLSNLSARLYGGSFIGKVAFTEGTEGPPQLSVTGDLQRVTVHSLMQALSNTQEFRGRGNVQINMTGRGNTALEAVQSAGGKFGLQLEKGSYAGINIGHELCKLYNGLRNKPAPPAPADKATHFDTFSATATVINGQAQTDDLLASNSYLKLSGRGRAKLARQSIDYDLDIELTGPIEATNCETLTPHIGSRIPVRLTGTFANPKLRPDFGKLAQREIVRRVEDKITEKLLDLLGGKKRTPEIDPDVPTEPKS